MSTPRNICLYASQIAGCIGKNKYVTLKESLTEAWKRHNPEGYRRALQKFGVQSDEERLAELCEASQDLKEVIAKAEKTSVSTGVNILADNLASAANQAVCNVASHSALDVGIVSGHIRRTLYTNHGQQQEASVLDAVQKHVDFEIVRDDTFYHLPMGIINATSQQKPWSIGGRIDGRSIDGKVVVEIKRRVRRLFKTPPAYEMVQIQVYLKLTGAEKAVWAESYAGAINMVDVYPDNDAWNTEIAPKLQEFVDALHRLMSDEEAQKAFFASTLQQQQQ